MNGLADDLIAIDTNLFMHLLQSGDGATNSDGHIDVILGRLSQDGISLLVDDKMAIAAEYEQYVIPLIQKANEMDEKRYLLAYWMRDAEHVVQAVDYKGNLFTQIQTVIHEKKEKCDRVFVFVAFARGCLLLTNDETHILWGPGGEANTEKDNRYTRLKKATKKLRQAGADILNSIDAHARLG